MVSLKRLMHWRIDERAPFGSLLRKWLMDVLILEINHLRPTGDVPREILTDLVEALADKCTGKKTNHLLDVSN